MDVPGLMGSFNHMIASAEWLTAFGHLPLPPLLRLPYRCPCFLMFLFLMLLLLLAFTCVVCLHNTCHDFAAAGLCCYFMFAFHADDDVVFPSARQSEAPSAEAQAV